MATFLGPDKKKEIEKYIQEKQQNEVDLANNITAEFNKGALITQLRLYTAAGLSNLIEIVIHARDSSILLNKVIVKTIDDERKKTLKVLKNYKGPPIKTGIDSVYTLNELLDKVDTFDAATCGEIVRLYGGIIENIAKGPSKDPFAVSTAWAKKKQTEFDKTPKLLEEFKGFVDDMTKGKGEAGEEILKNKKYDALRDSFRGGTTKEKDKKKVDEAGELTADDIWKIGRARFIKGAQQKDFEEARAAWGVGEVQAALDGLAGGQSLFAVKNSSTIGKIDHVFGLVPAADISGTTGDNAFFFKQVSCGNPIFYMLPLGPIVSGGHHSIAECAFVLSLNNINNYTIGKYTTLMPNQAVTGRTEIMKHLKAAEDDARNRRMVIAYDGTKKPVEVEGCWLFGNDDKKYNDFAHWKAALEFFAKQKGEPEGFFDKEAMEAILKKQKLIS